MTTLARPATVRRLRPGVAVTPLRAGLHLRGRAGSVTLEGSTALPALWKLLEEPLRSGGLEALLDGMAPGSAVRGAVGVLLGRLEEHGLLVTEDRPPHPEPRDREPPDRESPDRESPDRESPDREPPDREPPGAEPPQWEPVARWLGDSAARPAAAAAALAAARAEVRAGDPGAPLARAAGRALAQGGLPVAYTADPHLPPGRVLLRVHGAGPDRAVAAGRSGGGGYATAPGSPAQARSDARALEARLGPAGDGAPAALLPLLAGTAAHRLLCAAAGLPDPAAEGGDERLLTGLPAVLLADARPLRADYRTWLGPERLDTDRNTGLAPARTLDEALRRLDALGDGRCGVLPGPEPAGLSQLPVPLASCALPGGRSPGRRLTGGAPRLDLARLELFCRAAELLLGEEGATLGANPGHARGRALRAAAARLAAGPAVPEGQWSAHPQARHWFTTLTGRLGVAARPEVRRAAPGGQAYHAVVRRAGTPGAAPLGEAVEATPGDAAAFAALAAVSAVSAGPAGADAVRVPPSGGAVAPLATAGARIAVWEDPGWTNGWMADVARREERLQSALRRLTGAALTADSPASAPAGALASRLRAFGFTVLHTAPEEVR
ncbi:hypothetical protein ACIRBY_31040 [Streptomyces sp. NPDC096136]|uniref:hypothetical protein n=1 Tax=Streptomyces sp. NPDC096136 TaxID=3366076 RepID=UPI00380243CE